MTEIGGNGRGRGCVDRIAEGETFNISSGFESRRSLGRGGRDLVCGRFSYSVKLNRDSRDAVRERKAKSRGILRLFIHPEAGWGIEMRSCSTREQAYYVSLVSRVKSVAPWSKRANARIVSIHSSHFVRLSIKIVALSSTGMLDPHPYISLFSPHLYISLLSLYLYISLFLFSFSLSPSAPENICLDWKTEENPCCRGTAGFFAIVTSQSRARFAHSLEAWWKPSTRARNVY